MNSLLNGFSFIGSLLHCRGNFVDALLRVFEKNKDRAAVCDPYTMRLGFGCFRITVTANPALAHEILVERPTQFPKTEWERRVLRPGFEGGLIILEDAEWKKHRHALTPAFSPALMPSLAAIVRDATRSRIERWGAAPVDVSTEMRCIVNDVMYRYFLEDLGLKRAVDNERLPLRFAKLYEKIEKGLEARVFLPPPFRSPWLRPALRAIRARVSRDVSVEASACPVHGVLRKLKSALPSDPALSKEIVTMTGAGLTTAHLVTWLTQLLATNPEVQERLRDEILGSAPSLEAVEKLEYLTAVINEGLRLYPPAPFLIRKDPTGGFALISIWAMHRLPAYWKDPLQFHPERWLGTAAPKVFIPFGLGPRTCVGKRFAMIEARIILAEMISRFELSPVSAKAPSAKVNVLTRPSRHIQILFRPIA